MTFSDDGEASVCVSHRPTDYLEAIARFSTIEELDIGRLGRVAAGKERCWQVDRPGCRPGILAWGRIWLTAA